MATPASVTNAPANGAGQSAPETAEQLAKRMDMAIKAIPHDVIAALFAMPTIVNNLPEDMDRILSLGAECSAEFSNPTDYKVDALKRFIRSGVKADARGVVGAWEHTVDVYSRKYTKLTRDECIVELVKMRSNKDAQRASVVAAAILVELK